MSDFGYLLLITWAGIAELVFMCGAKSASKRPLQPMGRANLRSSNNKFPCPIMMGFAFNSLLLSANPAYYLYKSSCFMPLLLTLLTNG